MTGTRWQGALLLAIATPLPAQRVVTDLHYVPSGSEEQRLDLYLPAGRDFPTLVMIHGGGLTVGDKQGDSLPAICAVISRAGVGCAAINYRLGAQAPWPAQPEDVASAVAWLKAHIGEHGGDPARLALLGHSSGCLLASVLATDARYLAQQHLEPSAVRGVVAMGCTLSPVVPEISDSGRLRAFFASGRFPTFTSLEQFQDADPTAHASRSTPPFLVLIAEAEQINPPILDRAERFAERMTSLGRPARIAVLPGLRHYTALTGMADTASSTLRLVLEFVRSVTVDE